MPYSIKLSAMDIFNAIHCKAMIDTILAPTLVESVKLWMKHLQEKGWSTIYEPTPGEESWNGFTLGFCSPWQCKVCLNLTLISFLYLYLNYFS
jgi:hypothetical protein